MAWLLASSGCGLPMLGPEDLSATSGVSAEESVKFAGWPDELLSRPLMFDIGLYNGRDCLEALRTGARVVALDANPRMIEGAKSTFAPFIKSGQLQLRAWQRTSMVWRAR